MKDKRRLILFTIVLLLWFLGIQMYLKTRYVPPAAPAEEGQEVIENPRSDDGPGAKETPGTPAAGEKVPAPAIEPTPSIKPAEAGPANSPGEPIEAAVPEAGLTETAPQEKTAEIPEETMSLETGEADAGYLIRLTNRGAAILSVIRKDYIESKDEPLKKLELISSDYSGLRGLTLSDFKVRYGEALDQSYEAPEGMVPLHERTWKIVSSSKTEAVFETEVIPGIILNKKIVFNTEHGGFDVILTQTNTGAQRIRTAMDLLASPGIIPEYKQQRERNIKAYTAIIDGEGEEDADSVTYRKVKEKPRLRQEGRFAWIAGCNKYFTALTIHAFKSNENCEPVLSGHISGLNLDPEAEAAKTVNFNLAARILITSLGTPAGQSSRLVFTHHIIPIRKDDLKKAGIQYREMISLGLIDALGEMFLAILKGLHYVFPNWGIAIILLTIMVNMALYPLNKKGQISMQKMQKLQPIMKELRKKYKNNRAKMNEETMKLYHKHGVNPLGGCLPMLIQLPVFIGLYFSLQGSFELRQSVFLWITDLSLPDALFPLPFGFVSQFNLLPLLMSAAMFIQQKLSSVKRANAGGKSDGQPDTAQQMEGAMKIMPWIMLFIFYNFASGLVLYWLTNSILRIFETYHIKHRIIPRMEEADAAARDDKGRS